MLSLLSELTRSLNGSYFMPFDNATSFEVIINTASQNSYSFWVGALAAFLGAIFGSVISGIYLIKKVKEEKRLEFFGDVYENFYVPFEDLAYTVINKNSIDSSIKQELQEFYRMRKKWIFLSPDCVRKEMKSLFKGIESGEDEQVIINKLRKILSKIDKISNDMSYKG